MKIVVGHPGTRSHDVKRLNAPTAVTFTHCIAWHLVANTSDRRRICAFEWLTAHGWPAHRCYVGREAHRPLVCFFFTNLRTLRVEMVLWWNQSQWTYFSTVFFTRYTPNVVDFRYRAHGLSASVLLCESNHLARDCAFAVAGSCPSGFFPGSREIVSHSQDQTRSHMLAKQESLLLSSNFSYGFC